MNTTKLLQVMMGSFLLAVCPARTQLSAAIVSGLNPFFESFDLRGESVGDPSKKIATAILAPANEPGAPLIISGTVFQSDGKTPVANAVMYAYQTDANGQYSREKGGNREPRLKGRLTTGPDGRYEIVTIKPASYPGTKIPAHIHASLTVTGGKETSIDEFLFDGDRFLTKEDYSKYGGKGQFSSIVKTEKGKDGVLRGVRDIVFESK